MRVGLPWMTTSRPGCCLSFETSAARSPLMRCELFHSSFFNVFEATYLGMLLNRSAKPSSSFRPGQAAANPSYVTRPRRERVRGAELVQLEFSGLVAPEREAPLVGRFDYTVQGHE